MEPRNRYRENVHGLINENCPSSSIKDDQIPKMVLIQQTIVKVRRIIDMNEKSNTEGIRLD